MPTLAFPGAPRSYHAVGLGQGKESSFQRKILPFWLQPCYVLAMTLSRLSLRPLLAAPGSTAWGAFLLAAALVALPAKAQQFSDVGPVPGVYDLGHAGGSATLSVNGNFDGALVAIGYLPAFPGSPLYPLADCPDLTDVGVSQGKCSLTESNGTVRVTITGGGGSVALTINLGRPHQASVLGGGGGGGSDSWTDDGISRAFGTSPGFTEPKTITLSSGNVFFPNATNLLWRNGSDSADVPVFSMSSLNNVTISAGPSGPGQGTLRLEGNNNSIFESTTGSLSLTALDTSSSGFISLSAGGSSERVRIANTGNVGIGTTSPDSLIHVVGGGICIESIDSVCAAASGALIVQGSASFAGSTSDSAGLRVTDGLTLGVPGSNSPPVACSGAVDGHIYWDLNQSLMCRCDGTLWEGLNVGGGGAITCT